MSPSHMVTFLFDVEEIPKSNSEQCTKIRHGSVSVAINIYKGNFTTHNNLK